MYEESIVGDLINFRGLVYSPVNENGVVFLFGKVMEDLNMYIEEIKPGYPDCIGSLFCSFNTPERSFCFARLFKSSIRIRFFTGGKDFEGTTRIQDKWAEYSIKDDTGLDKAISMVRQAYNLIKIAIKNNEPTGLYSKVAMEDEENN